MRRESLYTLSPYFLIRFEGVFLTMHLSSISRFYPTGPFRGLILFIDLKMNSIKKSVTTAKGLLSSGNAPRTGTTHAPSSLYLGCLRVHLHDVHRTCIYMYIKNQ